VRDEHGVMIADLLITIIVIGALIATAIGSYLWFRDGAEEAAAAVNVRTATPAVEFWRTENRGTDADIDLDATTRGYEGLTTAALLERFKVAAIDVPVAMETEYCIASTVGGQTFYKYGPDGDITEVTPATPLCS
jgi:hypothetical protein